MKRWFSVLVIVMAVVFFIMGGRKCDLEDHS